MKLESKIEYIIGGLVVQTAAKEVEVLELKAQAEILAKDAAGARKDLQDCRETLAVVTKEKDVVIDTFKERLVNYRDVVDFLAHELEMHGPVNIVEIRKRIEDAGIVLNG